jgi:Ca2+-binding EF-hand superfamily protein
LRILVAFDTQDASRSRLDVIPNEQPTDGSQPAVHENSLTFSISGTLLEFSAIQSPSMTDADQISLGAVHDGYPLLPDADVNEDGRLTIRELRRLSACLATFDRDRDGAIARGELRPTLRVSFGLGPIVHRQLASVRSVHPATASPASPPPDWFARMDRNQDGDLTPREFLGGKDQFTALDADADGLISVTEANSKAG